MNGARELILAAGSLAVGFGAGATTVWWRLYGRHGRQADRQRAQGRSPV